MKNGDEMTKQEIEETADVNITDREYKYLQDFYCGTGVTDIYKLLLNFRYRLLQSYENRVCAVCEDLKNYRKLKAL